MNRTLCMETNWKGNRTQKIYKRDLAKHIVGFNEACENRSIVDYQIKLVPKTPHTSTHNLTGVGITMATMASHLSDAAKSNCVSACCISRSLVGFVATKSHACYLLGGTGCDWVQIPLGLNFSGRAGGVSGHA